MENQNNIGEASTNQIIKQVINYWTDRNKAVTNFINKYPDDAYYKEVAPNRSRAIYLFGHLIAVNDALLPMFALGEKLFPEYDAIFLSVPDKSVADLPSLPELKKSWEKLNETLADHFNKMTANEWLDRHMSVSVEDFKHEPLRNKLNVLINRTNHQSYHLGQMILLNA
ncbi:MAG TPA: DinB family protein [Puia sp.]